MTDAFFEVLSALGTFFSYALVAVFAQNTIFSRALGVSRLVKLVNDDAVDSFIYCALLCAVQVLCAPLGFVANMLFGSQSFWPAVRPLVLVICAGIAFVVVLLAVVTLMPATQAKKFAAVLPMATFNCTILGALLLTTTQSFTLLQTIGFALGSALGYALAVYVLTEGERKLQNDVVPRQLRGLPITLLYISILTLAVYGFTGHMIVF